MSAHILAEYQQPLIPTKLCTRCGSKGPFCVNNRNLNGLTSHCKVCIAEAKAKAKRREKEEEALFGDPSAAEERSIFDAFREGHRTRDAIIEYLAEGRLTEDRADRLGDRIGRAFERGQIYFKTIDDVVYFFEAA